MTHTRKRTLSYFFLAVFLIGLLAPFLESEATPRRRRCNPKLGKQRAMEYLQSNERLARLGDVTYIAPTVDPNSRSSFLNNDGEILTDVEDVDLDRDAQALLAMESQDQAAAGDENLDITVFEDDWLSYMDDIEESEDITAGGIYKAELMQAIVSWFGTRYRFGGTTKRGIDCSAFMQKIYNQAANLRLPRTARWQHKVGSKIEAAEELRFGDLVFFNTRRRVYVSHVGVYIGDNLFAHSSSRYGVTISSLESNYYSKRFIGGKRLTVEDVARLGPTDIADFDETLEQSGTQPSDTLSSH